MTHPLRGQSAIVGAVDAVSPTGSLDRTASQLEVDMVRAALDDAGLSIRDVDSVISTSGMMASLDLAERMGVRGRYTDTTMTGGSSFEVHVEHAAAAISAGYCEVAVIVYAATPRSGKNPFAGGPSMGGDLPFLEWDLPYGFGLPASSYSLAARRHMHEYGTTSEQLAEIAVAFRAWAAKNPNAYRRDPISVDDVLASPMVAEPLHKLDCCLVTDGAGALVMTSAERARDLRRSPVYVLGAGTAHTHGMSISQMPDLTTSGAAVSGPNAFAMAGVRPADVDVVELYDSFTITALMTLEDLGFCAKGEGGAFVEGGRLGPGGDLPTNTNGGGLSYTHPGMYGMFVLVEAVRQLRGEVVDRQVAGAEIAVANGCGGVLSCTSTIVLGTESTL
ncbi:MAG: acetyl-CoA acetyltransferase [Acidimicrobiales bacterium]|nr:acetyl-CoA acetyltransferase [Acidimicrobiales bacterium]